MRINTITVSLSVFLSLMVAKSSLAGAISTGISQTFKVSPNGLERVTGEELMELKAKQRAMFLNTDPEQSGRAYDTGFDVTSETKEALIYSSLDPTTRQVIGAIQNFDVIPTYGEHAYRNITWYKVLYGNQIGYLNGNVVEESDGQIVNIKIPTRSN